MNKLFFAIVLTKFVTISKITFTDSYSKMM